MVVSFAGDSENSKLTAGIGLAGKRLSTTGVSSLDTEASTEGRPMLLDSSWMGVNHSEGN
jgi:hypothetical protein